MRLIVLGLFAVLLTACAGNPPEWWNPSGIYNTDKTKNTSAQSVQSIPSGSSTVQAEDETPAEQTIDAVWDESYEEMNLEPIDEKADAERAISQAANKSLTDTSGQVQVPVKKVEPIPTDTSLPPPSVLD